MLADEAREVPHELLHAVADHRGDLVVVVPETAGVFAQLRGVSFDRRIELRSADDPRLLRERFGVRRELAGDHAGVFVGMLVRRQIDEMDEDGTALDVPQELVAEAVRLQHEVTDERAMAKVETLSTSVANSGRILQVGRDVAPADAYASHVLMIETSEDMPPATEVYWILRHMGLRGLLADTPAVLVGRPKAWDIQRRTTPEQKQRYVDDQRAAILRALDTYAPDATVVFNVDFGHTDPQLIMPYGGFVKIDGPRQRISVRY